MKRFALVTAAELPLFLAQSCLAGGRFAARSPGSWP